jgi:putative transposase
VPPADSQAVKTTAQGGERGDDGGKNIHGRRRHVRVDVVGLLLAVVVSRAAINDAVAAPRGLQPLGPETDPRLAVIGADTKYHQHALHAWIETEAPGTWRLDMVRRPPGTPGFVLLPKRWVVERTFAWLGRCRRHRKDDERRTDSSESMLRIRAIHHMRKRLKPSAVYPPFRYRVPA